MQSYLYNKEEHSLCTKKHNCIWGPNIEVFLSLKTLLNCKNKFCSLCPSLPCRDVGLEKSAPEMFMHLMNGGFTVRRSGKIFNCVPSDQALEQLSINCEAKSRGGIIGFTLRKGALMRWLLTRYVTGEYSQSFKSILPDTKFQE